jgi:hypothetical protein
MVAGFAESGEGSGPVSGQTGCFSRYVVGVTLSLIVALTSACSHAQSIASAADYCSNFGNSVRLNEDGTVLCFDGLIGRDQGPQSRPP